MRSKYDRPAYTLSTFIPRQTLKFYLALRALNVSLSMIPDTTSSYTIGLMRLQFWRDTITRTLSGTPPKEPVAVLLGSATADLDTQTGGHARISRGWFMRMINAREQALTNTPYPDLAALESYAENTYSTLLYLTLSALPMSSLTADHLASHVGKAVGIAAVLRGLPLVAFPPPQSHKKDQAGVMTSVANVGGRQGAITLPLDVMAQAGVKEEDVFRHGADASGLRDAVFTVATRASDHLITAREMLKNLRAGQDVGHKFEHEGEEGHDYGMQESSSESRLKEAERSIGVLMPAVSAQLWLDRLQKVDFDIFRPELLGSDWRLPWKAYIAFRKGTF
jgi:NADH dehydrogenase [ubiquinone] 1 alpha subcomplex assembly factor 6